MLGALRIFWMVVAAVFAVAPSVYALPLTLVSHSGSASTDAQMAGFALASESDSPASATDPAFGASSLSETGSGSAHSSILARAESTLTNTATTNDLLLGSSVFYAAAGSGGPRPGGTGNSSISSSWLFSLNAISVDLTFDVATFLPTPFAPSTSSLLVENLTTSETILSLTNPAAIFESTLNFTGSHGDAIAITYTGSASLTPGVGASTTGDGADFNLSFDTVTVAEPGSMAGFVIGLAGLIVLRRRRIKRVV